MFYLIFFVLLATPIAILVGLFYAYRKMPHTYFLLLLVLLVGGPYGAYKIYERGFMMSVIPDALHVNSISYRKEESWGFGPGGNEAGVRIYPLSEEVANHISQSGIEFFKKLPPNQNQRERDWRGIYGEWSETPIKPGRNWQVNEKTNSLNVYDYICAYGFCIDIDSLMVQEANLIINSPGSYYAYGRVGLIVVVPGKKLVLYMYNG